ncbi:MAG: hypothetical protein U5K76_09945 [Woeseiaceae bacterium]|nr:hypothetical protein [Woeseiaceae bacterium]
MKFEMQPMPYDYDALEPHISARTLEFHYDKHHAGYMKKLEAAIADTPRADQGLDRLSWKQTAVYSTMRRRSESLLLLAEPVT